MNITIGRLPEDPSIQTAIQPEDGSWQVLVDKEGIPHFYVRVHIEAGPDTGGKPTTGMFCIEDMLPEGETIRGLMEGAFGGALTPEEQAAAAEDFARSRAETGIPCPRYHLLKRRT